MHQNGQRPAQCNFIEVLKCLEVSFITTAADDELFPLFLRWKQKTTNFMGDSHEKALKHLAGNMWNPTDQPDWTRLGLTGWGKHSSLWLHAQTNSALRRFSKIHSKKQKQEGFFGATPLKNHSWFYIEPFSCWIRAFLRSFILWTFLCKLKPFPRTI